jgi:hypothetical protein
LSVRDRIHPQTGKSIDHREYWDATIVNGYIKHYPGNLLANLPEEMIFKFKAIKEDYNKPDKLSPDQLLDSPIPNCEVEVPKWFQDAYRTREIPFMLFDALVNHAQHHGRSPESERIRRSCYSILGIDEVTEYQLPPEGKVVVKIVKRAIMNLLPLDQIEHGDLDKKTRIFDSALRLGDYQLDEENKFFMSTVIFWRFQTTPPECVVKALIASYVRLSSTANKEDIVCLSRQTRLYQIDPRIRQYLIKWQCVYRDALALSLLLRYPSRIPCPSAIFDETIVLSLASKSDEMISAFIGDAGLLITYRDILGILGYAS